jgi:hypothetical protein
MSFKLFKLFMKFPAPWVLKNDEIWAGTGDDRQYVATVNLSNRDRLTKAEIRHGEEVCAFVNHLLANVPRGNMGETKKGDTKHE